MFYNQMILFFLFFLLFFKKYFVQKLRNIAKFIVFTSISCIFFCFFCFFCFSGRLSIRKLMSWQLGWPSVLIVTFICTWTIFPILKLLRDTQSNWFPMESLPEKQKKQKKTKKNARNACKNNEFSNISQFLNKIFLKKKQKKQKKNNYLLVKHSTLASLWVLAAPCTTQGRLAQKR